MFRLTGKRCVQSQLNLRQSPHNCGALHLLLAPSALGATLNTNLGPAVWKQKGVVGGSVDWKVFLLAMLDEAANCPRPCKANLHVQSSFFFPPLPHYRHCAVSLLSQMATTLGQRA